MLKAEGFLQISDGQGALIVVFAVEALRKPGDPVGFSLEIGAELPEAGQLGGIGWRGGDGNGNRHGGMNNWMDGWVSG